PGAGDDPDRFLRGALWTVLGLATVVFWAALRPLPWLGDPPRGDLTERQLLHELPLPALAAGGALLLVFVASVTLCLRPAPWLSAAALGSALVALHAAPIASGRELRAGARALCSGTAGFVADAGGLDGPGPLPRWSPAV